MSYGKMKTLRNRAGEGTSLVGNYQGSKEVFLIDDLAKRKATAALVFSGQGFTYFAEIISLYQHSFAARRWINAAFEELHKLFDDDFIVFSGLLNQRVDLYRWLEEPPENSELQRSMLSQPLVLVTQIARYLSLFENGLDKAFEARAITVVSGHSQGMLPALLIAEHTNGQIQIPRALQYVRYALWQGVLMEKCYRRLAPNRYVEQSPMAALGGLMEAQLSPLLQKFNSTLPVEKQVCVSAQATLNRWVLSGEPTQLLAFKQQLDAYINQVTKQRKQGRFAGTIPNYTWESIAVNVAFHHPMLWEAKEEMRKQLPKVGLQLAPDRFTLPVIASDCAVELTKINDLNEWLLEQEFIAPVRWFQSMQTLRQSMPVDCVLGFGPGDGIEKLIQSALRGNAVQILPLATKKGQKDLFQGSFQPNHCYRSFAPMMQQGKLSNQFTRLSNKLPIILPGMTPTTVDADIVVAAANAGYVAELAGGGQVTAEIFWKRMEECKEKLQPGYGIVFNALYLDRYLWKLHMGPNGLVFQAKQAGFPLQGVTISAGIPEVHEAVALLDRLADGGMHCNAFKPGSVAQIQQVVQIAKAAPQHSIYVHVEGGKAGGHHSWEPLESLLLATYHLLRGCSNVVLCVGGGVADPQRASEMLHGTWSHRYGLVEMPVDAVLLGTLCMAVKEAKTSDKVKQALVSVAGCQDWVLTGTSNGGITSGKSQLNADIHYIDNRAARCGRLLDQVAGDGEAVAKHRDSIISLLNQTAKPYFGDLERMTYEQVLRRMIHIMAIGTGDPYQDGVWLDRTHRQRFADMVWRAEARLIDQDNGHFTSILENLDQLDQPVGFLNFLEKQIPRLSQVTLQPSDVDYFVYKICQRPGKPVNFVPVIDANVRRWYKSDSLWQSHDNRYDADQVLIIPGPEAVRGLCMKDEPIADLFGRFLQQVEDDATRENHVHTPPFTSVTDTVGFISKGDELIAMNDEANWFTGTMDLPEELAKLWRITTIWVGSREIINPIHRLCKLRVGGTLRTSPNQILCKPDPEQDVCVLLQRNDGQLEMLVDGPQLHLEMRFVEQQDGFFMSKDAYDKALLQMFHHGLFGHELSPIPLFQIAKHDFQFSQQQRDGYVAVTGSTGSDVPLNFCFSIAWKSIMAALSCPELAGSLLQLVHLNNAVTAGSAWPPLAEETLQVSAQVCRLERQAKGAKLFIRSKISCLRGECASMTSSFFLRDHPWYGLASLQVEEQFEQTIELLHDEQLQFISEQPFVEFFSAPTLGTSMVWVGSYQEHRFWQEKPLFSAIGEIRQAGKVIGAVNLHLLEDIPHHPLLSLFDMLAVEGKTSGKRKHLAKMTVKAPTNMRSFAMISGDLNPIHRFSSIARLAKLDDVIVHGMWTAGAMLECLKSVAEKQFSENIQGFDVRFMAPVALGEELEFTVCRTGVQNGSVMLLIEAKTVPNKQLVASATATVSMPKTAYVFPGQGIQSKGMGMEAYGRSVAAREVWNQADRHTRTTYGFSILQIVKENPIELFVEGQLIRHPKGLLHLTQFTQVAMATLARAQVAEMREAGVFQEDAITCGHSIGEYNAIGAVLDILPLPQTIDVVYRRGLEMHALVPRDAAGNSDYRMGVIRPHYAGLNHHQAEQLVLAIQQETGQFIQIVNYNVEGRQYAVTGSLGALQLLQDRLQPIANKAPYIEVPGIDVPFHSRMLRDGVASFRRALDHALPITIEPSQLVGRYIPNLTAVPFRLDQDYIREILSVADSQPLRDALDNWDEVMQEPEVLTRLMLVELLAWQFASPVRWIETQEVLFTRTSSLARIVEIGLGTQPTVANMARYTQRLKEQRDISIYNVETDYQELFALDEDQVVEPVKSDDSVVEQTSVEQPLSPIVETVQASEVMDRTIEHQTGLLFMIAVQANLRCDQIIMNESIEEIFEGVSSRRNQLLLDIGAEFSVGAIDGVHEKPLVEVVEMLKKASPQYTGGAYINTSIDEAVVHFFGPSGLKKKDIYQRLQQKYALGKGLNHWALVELALQRRTGTSNRGGKLGVLESIPQSLKEAMACLDQLVLHLSQVIATPLPALANSTVTTAVDAAAVQELEARIIGENGAVMQMLREAAGSLGHQLQPQQTTTEQTSNPHAAVLMHELGEGYAKRVKGCFTASKHCVFASPWAAAQRDVAALFHELIENRISAAETSQYVSRLATFREDPRVASTAKFYGNKCQTLGYADAAQVFQRILDPSTPTNLQLISKRPYLTWNESGHPLYQEKAASKSIVEGFLQDIWRGRNKIRARGYEALLQSVLHTLVTTGEDFSKLTVVMTGASPHSIAAAILRQLLRGGATVLLTTTNPSVERLAYYQELYESAAGPKAELHVLPMNQASTTDIDAMLNWMFEPAKRSAYGKAFDQETTFVPNLLLPFGAIKDLATMDVIEGASEAAMRALLIGVERLIAGIAVRLRKLQAPACHVVLPLSPNHGVFGGDGLYGESKAALETLFNRWYSEQDRWGSAITLSGAVIGWVRGTNLMQTNNTLAPALEKKCGIRSFSNDEMGLLLTALCSSAVRQKAVDAPIRVDFSGGLNRIDNLKSHIHAIQSSWKNQAEKVKRERVLQEEFQMLTGVVEKTPRLHQALPSIVTTRSVGVGDVSHELQPRDLVVIVGAGELGPWGSKRTRFSVEFDQNLSAAAVVELAWMTGLIRYDKGWFDVETDEALAEAEIYAKYIVRVRERAGIRFIDPVTVGFDPKQSPAYTAVYLEKDFSFAVSSKAAAESFLRADPKRTKIAQHDDGWQVVRMAGSVIRIPKSFALTRQVGGIIPEGFDLRHYGIPQDMIETVDRLTLYNLVATVDAWISSGLTPEELLHYIHPAKIGNTQSSGIGGMQSLRRLYQDHLLAEERQGDILQETLLNVMAAYVVQAYVGGYGPMSHPVGACATAALSVESGVEKILLGKAEFVVAGGYDDIGVAGMVGFADMNATAATDEMVAQGLLPHQFSRPNDARRGGFVESQGGGTILLARGDVALKMGLPVLGVIAYSGSFSDGIYRSIPAPGQGLLAAACGGSKSPLAQALTRHGLTTDDISLVYKHDTSTAANDVNENALHHRIQQELGRSEGNPLWVVSQKHLTGHSKGGAAAWQLIGLCQAMREQKVPGNRNLLTVDPQMRSYDTMCFTNRSVHISQAQPLKAGLVTSLGFGHVSAVLLVLHPDYFIASIPPEQRNSYREAASQRVEGGQRKWQQIKMGKTVAYQKRVHRRFRAADNSPAQKAEEAAMLLSPNARLHGQYYGWDVE